MEIYACVVILLFTILAYLTNANDEFCTKANDCQVSIVQIIHCKKIVKKTQRGNEIWAIQ